MNDAEKRAYASGYNANKHMRWPEHKPPTPPDERVAALFLAARALRDGVDGQIATFDQSDPICQALAPLIDSLDEEMARWSKWLKQHEDLKS